MQIGPAILIVATMVQFAAAVVAVWLIRVTGRKWAWAVIAAALGVILIRRTIRLYTVLAGSGTIPVDPSDELLTLGISLLFLFGLLGIVPLFRMYARLADDLLKAQAHLEQRVRDRTAELAATNESLQQERYLLHTLMDYLPHNIYFKDAESRFLRVNKAMARYVSLGEPREAIGKTDLDFFTDEHGQQALADEKEILRTGQGIVTKVEKETWPDGRTTWASSTKLPLLDDEGNIVGTFGISQDITAQMQDAEALRAAKETAEAASRAKSTFLANMSHEIRTPLNAVIGMTELVLKSQLSAQQREYLSTVRDSGEALLSVINDILDFSKIEAEKLVLEREQFHFRESLGDTMKSFALRAHQQGLELACYIHRDVPTWLLGDYCRVRQVVVNLVNNAIKFTKRGEVVVEVACEPCGDDDVQLHFTVSDTGIGIPAEKHAAVFDMFEQADSSTTRRHGGTGLGLAIAAKLVALMGGKIWLESELGRGSHFHFTACLGRVEAEPAESVEAEPLCLHGMRALVVDDNATNRRILDEVLASWQMVPTCVETAGEALELMRQAEQAGRPFQLVLTDAHMPEVDGFMLAGDIRKQYQATEPVIMMLTSGDRPSDIAECDRLGIASYLLKPIKQSELLEAIQLSLGLVGPRNPLVAPAHTCQCRPLRILLAEDSLVNQQLAVALLSGEGHEVTVANNGREAVAAVETGTFDVVLMDVQMPEMDGLEATAIIRSNEAARGRGTREAPRLPIIAMTAHALAGDRERCIDAGMDGYTSKPINADELFAAIKGLATSPSEPPPAASADGDPVDWDAALKTVRGDQRLLTMIVETALGEIPELLAAVRGAVTGGDPKALRRAAHTIKGSVRYFGANRMTELAARLESLAEKENFHAARETLPALGDASDELIASLASHVAKSNSSKSGEVQSSKAQSSEISEALS